MDKIKPMTEAELNAQAQVFDDLVKKLQHDAGDYKRIINQIGNSLGVIKIQMQEAYNEPIRASEWGGQRIRLPVKDYVKKIYGERTAFSMPGIDRYSVLDLNEYCFVPEPVIDIITTNPEAQWVPEPLSDEDREITFLRDKTSQQTQKSQRVDIEVTRLSTPLNPGVSLFVDREVWQDGMRNKPSSILHHFSLTGFDGGIARMGFILQSTTIEAIIKIGVKK